MDFSKVGASVKITEHSKHLGEKISKLSADVIKNQVSQDTAYWDLRQKLHQVEGNRERLQQNLVDVQIQFETVSSQYQEELRQRPEVLNKLSSTREICDVLEEYSTRLKQTLSRCKTDQDALCAAYHDSGQLVHDIKAAHQHDNDRNSQIIRNLEEKVKLSESNQSRLMEIFNVTRQQLEREAGGARDQLSAAQRSLEQLQHERQLLRADLDSAYTDIHKKDEEITNLKNETKKLIDEFNIEMDGAKNAMEKRNRDLEEATKTANDLKKALSNQENFSQNLVEKINVLEDKILALQEENEIISKRCETQEMEIQGDKNEICKLLHEIEKLTELANSKDETAKTLLSDVDRLKELIAVIEHEKRVMNEEYHNKEEECKRLEERGQRLDAEVNALRAEGQEIYNKLQTYKESTEKQIQDLNETIVNQNKDIDAKVVTINEMMSEMQVSTETNNKLRDELQKTTLELEQEKDLLRETEVRLGMKIEQLQDSLNNKENELSRNMTLLLETKNEKDRLIEKIAVLEASIDKVQKQLGGARASIAHPGPQPDLEHALVFQEERTKAENNNMRRKDVYEMFSDDSTDSMGIAKRYGGGWKPNTQSSQKRPRCISNRPQYPENDMDEQVVRFPTPPLPRKNSALNKTKRSERPKKK